MFVLKMKIDGMHIIFVVNTSLLGRLKMVLMQPFGTSWNCCSAKSFG